MTDLLLFLLAVVAVVIAIRLGSRPHLVFAIADGSARLVRGRPPGRLLAALDEVARHHPEAAGRIEISGRGEKLALRSPGLDAGLRQRVWNTILLYRDRIA